MFSRVFARCSLVTKRFMMRKLPTYQHNRAVIGVPLGIMMTGIPKRKICSEYSPLEKEIILDKFLHGERFSHETMSSIMSDKIQKDDLFSIRCIINHYLIAYSEEDITKFLDKVPEKYLKDFIRINCAKMGYENEEYFLIRNRDKCRVLLRCLPKEKMTQNILNSCHDMILSEGERELYFGHLPKN
jgi:hypothetical protein